MELRVEYEWEDVPLEPTSVALVNLKQVIGCACEDIPDMMGFGGKDWKG